MYQGTGGTLNIDEETHWPWTMCPGTSKEQTHNHWDTCVGPSRRLYEMGLCFVYVPEIDSRS